jgi:hypothetical protein
MDIELDDNKVIEYLQNKSKEQDLVNKALLGAKEYLISCIEEEYQIESLKIDIENVEFKFREILFCFSNLLSYCYFNTVVDINKISNDKSENIGYYKLISLTNGEIIDTYLLINEYYKTLEI